MFNLVLSARSTKKILLANLVFKKNINHSEIEIYKIDNNQFEPHIIYK